MDHLSQITDETLENRKEHIPAAEAIIEEIKDEFKNLKKLMKFIKKLYKKNTKLDNSSESEIKLDEILKRDIWWDASECLNYGLVDGIKEN